MKYKVVTCFDETLLKLNGSKLIEQFASSWQPSIDFHCYYYNLDLSNYSLPKKKNIYYHNLNDVDGFSEFMERNKTHDGTEGGSVQYNSIIDVISEGPKVFAISEEAFKDNDSWLFWLDANCCTVRDIRLNSLKAIFSDDSNALSLALVEHRNHFAGFNLQSQSVVELLADVKGAYITDRFTDYREWGFNFILGSILPLYQARGLNYKLFTENGISVLNNLFVDLRDPASRKLRDAKGNRIVPLSDKETSPDILPGRYKQLADIVRHYKPQTILETGTWNGGRAIEMSLAAFEKSDKVHYIGYDLFEDATPEIDQEEFNSKAHNTLAAVEARLTEFQEFVKKERQKDFSFELTKGNVKDVLNIKADNDIDFALIGSGNSFNTVEYEYNTLKDIPVVVADHYFTKDEAEEIPPDAYQGVNQVFKAVPTKEVKSDEVPDVDGWVTFDDAATTRKYVLPSSDRVLGGGTTHLAVFLHDPDLKDLPEDVKRVPIVVHPRDCVPKDYIVSNIQTNIKMIGEDNWVSKHPPHREVGIVVSAGPYLDCVALKEFMHTYLARGIRPKILTVKHAYPTLLKNGIIPWGCIVLDPRSIEGKSTHNIVRKDLFKDINKETLFFVASMTDPSVTKHIRDGNGKIWGWHAFTDFMRQEQERGTQIVNQTVQLNEELGIPQGATLITGGTCAAMRGIGLMHTMGFREIHLFGFDCCREEPTAEEKTETTGDIEGGETPKPKYIQVNVGDVTYWTTGELLAMAQDCEKVFDDPGLDGVLEFHGENTMISALWDIKQSKEKRPAFKDYYA